jgi:hypothetical protein
MSAIPDTSNFYSSLHTTLPRERVAELFRALGFTIGKCAWDEEFVVSDWAELVIEVEGPILMHGPVADVLTNSEKLLARLRQAGIEYTAECYDEHGALLREYRWSNAPQT